MYYRLFLRSLQHLFGCLPGPGVRFVLYPMSQKNEKQETPTPQNICKLPKSPTLTGNLPATSQECAQTPPGPIIVQINSRCVRRILSRNVSTTNKTKTSIPREGFLLCQTPTSSVKMKNWGCRIKGEEGRVNCVGTHYGILAIYNFFMSASDFIFWFDSLHCNCDVLV